LTFGEHTEAGRAKQQGNDFKMAVYVPFTHSLDVQFLQPLKVFDRLKEL